MIFRPFPIRTTAYRSRSTPAFPASYRALLCFLPTTVNFKLSDSGNGLFPIARQSWLVRVILTPRFVYFACHSVHDRGSDLRSSVSIDFAVLIFSAKSQINSSFRDCAAHASNSLLSCGTAALTSFWDFLDGALCSRTSYQHSVPIAEV